MRRYHALGKEPVLVVVQSVVDLGPAPAEPPHVVGVRLLLRVFLGLQKLHKTSTTEE